MVSVIATASSARAQITSPPAIEWQRSFGGTNNDYLTSLRQESDGGFVFGGYKSSQSSDSADFWVVRLDAQGNQLAERSLGGSEHDELASVVRTSDGGLLLDVKTYFFALPNRSNVSLAYRFGVKALHSAFAVDACCAGKIGAHPPQFERISMDDPPHHRFRHPLGQMTKRSSHCFNSSSRAFPFTDSGHGSTGVNPSNKSSPIASSVPGPERGLPGPLNMRSGTPTSVCLLRCPGNCLFQQHFSHRGHNPGQRLALWTGLRRFGTALGRHLGRLKMQESQSLQALGRRDGVHRGYMGMPAHALGTSSHPLCYLRSLL